MTKEENKGLFPKKHVFSVSYTLTRMEKIIWIVIALLSGAILPIQAGLNNKLARAGNNAAYASLISFLVGVLALILYIGFTTQQVQWKGFKELPLHAWAGGILGAFYVTVIVLVFPRIGPGLTFSLVIAGQILISMLMEHFQILEAQHQPLSIGRLAGMFLIIAGVVLVKKF